MGLRANAEARPANPQPERATARRLAQTFFLVAAGRREYRRATGYG